MKFQLSISCDPEMSMMSYIFTHHYQYTQRHVQMYNKLGNTTRKWTEFMLFRHHNLFHQLKAEKLRRPPLTFCELTISGLPDSSPVCGFQHKISPALLPLTRCLPYGAHAIHRTQFLCPEEKENIAPTESCIRLQKIPEAMKQSPELSCGYNRDRWKWIN